MQSGGVVGGGWRAQSLAAPRSGGTMGATKTALPTALALR
jgi:hypothetical protein